MFMCVRENQRDILGESGEEGCVVSVRGSKLVGGEK